MLTSYNYASLWQCLVVEHQTRNPAEGPHGQYAQSTQPAMRSLSYLCEDRNSSQ